MLRFHRAFPIAIATLLNWVHSFSMYFFIGLFPLSNSNSNIAFAKFRMGSVPILAIPTYRYRSVETVLAIAISLYGNEVLAMPDSRLLMFRIVNFKVGSAFNSPVCSTTTSAQSSPNTSLLNRTPPESHHTFTSPLLQMRQHNVQYKTEVNILRWSVTV